MNKFKVLIADDEAPARSKMKRLLAKFEDFEIIHLAENGLEALEHIEKMKPDIVFLDIEMPGLTGLEVAANLKGDKLPQIVFATAYNEHAIRAFELNAIDYLLKPFNEERLGAALNKITKNIEKPTKTSTRDKLENLRKDPNAKLPFSSKIPIPTHDRYKLVDFSEVVCIEVEDRSTLLYTMEKSYTMSQTLDYFEKRLPSDKFMRVNRSSLIGLEHVKEMVIWFGNRFKIILNNGKEVISSREKSKILKQILKF